MAAAELALKLREQYEGYALAGAKAALRAVGHLGDQAGLALWAEVCAILASDETITIM